MKKSPYRKEGSLDAEIRVPVEKYVADALKAMAGHTNMSEGELVNTALRRFISTHTDYFPGRRAPKDPIR